MKTNDETNQNSPAGNNSSEMDALIRHTAWLTKTLAETGARLCALEDFVRDLTIDLRGDTRDTAVYLGNIERYYTRNINEWHDATSIKHN